MVATERRESVERRQPDIDEPELRKRRSRFVEGRVQGRTWERTGQGEDDPLGATALRQVVVAEGNGIGHALTHLLAE
jgi:hypothetical protein